MLQLYKKQQKSTPWASNFCGSSRDSGGEPAHLHTGELTVPAFLLSPGLDSGAHICVNSCPRRLTPCMRGFLTANLVLPVLLSSPQGRLPAQNLHGRN